MRQPHELLLHFILLHISNGLVSASLVGHVLYSADLMSAICISHILLRTDERSVEEQSNNRVILWNDVLSYLGE